METRSAAIDVTSVSDVAEVVAECSATRSPVQFVGDSTWIDAGRSAHPEHRVSVRELRQVAEYVPGNLTITVGAGMTLGELAEITGAGGQWLPIDPHGSDAGTIGATVATGSSGPLAGGFGRIRDMVLGIEMVTGRGDVIRGGGRVVKNVAGFDIVRLATGSWGSLGVITEVSLRLYARPARDVTVGVEVQGDIALFLAGVTALPIQPWAMELASPSLAHRLGLRAKTVLLARIGGNEAHVASQLRALDSIGGTVAEFPDVWRGLRGAEAAGDSVLRISSLPADFARTWTIGETIVAAAGGGHCHASPLLGVTRVVIPAGAVAHDALLSHLADDRIRVIFERLPAVDWAMLSPSVAGDRLSRGVKSAFDPHDIMNPGILGS